MERLGSEASTGEAQRSHLLSAHLHTPPQGCRVKVRPDKTANESSWCLLYWMERQTDIKAAAHVYFVTEVLLCGCQCHPGPAAHSDGEGHSGNLCPDGNTL